MTPTPSPTPTQPVPARLASALTAIWRATPRRLFLDRQAELWLGELAPTRSRTELRARVVDVVLETHDTRTFVLQPNARWPGHRAGQHVTVAVEIDGVRHTRCYSISSGSSGPGAARVAITVKRVPGGRVSGWLHDHVHRGDVLRLGAVGGDFVLPAPPAPRPPRLLLLSGGSGVTPVMAILRDLAARAALTDVVFVHHARSKADVIFGAELATLAVRHPELRVVLELDDAPAGGGGFDPARLAALVPDFAARATYLCGPVGLTARVERMWADAGAAAQLHLERFVAPAPLVAIADGAAAAVQVTLTRAQRTVAATGGATLLDQLELAGERPAAGCRMGICHTCTCRKQSGTVQNLVTGEVSSQPDELIRLCVSVPRSDVALSL